MPLSCLVGVFCSQAVFLKGLEKGVNDFGNQRAREIEHFGISKGRGGVKMFMPLVVGYGYFLESPIGTLLHAMILQCTSYSVVFC